MPDSVCGRLGDRHNCDILLTRAVYVNRFIMAAVWNRSRHYTFILWFLLLSSSFFLAYSQPSQIGCLPYFHTWCGLCANLECRSENCCTRLAKKFGIWPPSHNFVGLYLRNSGMHRQSKIFLNSNISSTCHHNMADFSPLMAEIGSPVWAPQQISMRIASCLRYCSDVAHRGPTKLCTMFGRLLGWYTIHTLSGALAA